MITYRAARPEDAEDLAELGRTSFVDAFGHLYSEENLNWFLDSAYTFETAAADIADPQKLFRIAESEGRMVGYCKIGFEVTLEHDPGDRRTMELKQLYIRGKQTGTGIGASLMEWALGEARSRGFDEVILSVWSENHGAQRFYARYGFEKIADTYFMVGDHRDDEFLLAVRF